MEENEEPTAESFEEGQGIEEESTENNELETGEETTDATPEEGEVQSNQDDSESIVTFGDEEASPASETNPELVKHLRKVQNQTAKENRELRKQLEAIQAPKQEFIAVGEKPTLESVDYDDARFEKELTEWYETKRKADDQQYQLQKRQDDEQKEWQQKLNDYDAKKQKLSFADVDESESIVQSMLNTTQQGLIIQGADDPALVVYALGKNTKKLQEISTIKDPVKFAFSIAKLEGKLNVKSRKAATMPEKKVSGNAPVSGSLDNTLEKLRAEAERTGDMSKVTEYRRKKRRSA